jgi:hypothetical protein
MRLFSLRSGETFSVSIDAAPPDARYVVARVDLPELPGPHAEGGSQAVVAAELFDGNWHWPHLDPLTKQDLGEFLEHYEIGEGWHELRLTKDSPPSPPA